WPFFLIRSAIALGFWSWMARSLMRGGPLLPGPALLVHGVIVSFIAFDWIMGVAPAQPNSAIGMVLATMQIGAACAFACLARMGDLRRRRDFSYLMIACGLALAYFLYMDFVIVWFGNLPAHVGWYLDRHDLPAALLPGLCLILGLFAPALLVPALRGDRGRVWSAASALIALALIDDWFVAGPDGWAGLAAMIASIAVVLFLALPVRREARA
ncbi:MAG TPA: hypothetical protein VFL92_05770, partial [Sphingomonas sp.]|nr:hypothetical protein [Sphingomonas sp.]